MSNFEVQILEPSVTILEVETISGNNISNIEIIQSGSSIIQLNSNVSLLPSEFNVLVDGQIASFIGAGSGIGIESSPGGMTISSLISAGSGIIIDYNSGIYNISSNIPDLSIENVQDTISTFLVASSGIVLNYQDNNNQLLIGTTGLQPSGSYANAIHSHVSSDITDFNSSVENLTVVKNISAGSGIDISSTSGLFTVSVTGTFGLTGEEVDDRVNELLVGSNHIHLNYNDSLNTLTISTSGLQPSGDYSVSGHSHSSSEITNFNSSVSGLLPSITGSGYINSVFNTNTNSYTVKLNLPNCGSECAEYFVVFGNGSGQLDLTPHVWEEQIAFRTLGQGSVIDFESQTGYTVFSQIDSALAARSLASHEHGNITSSGHIGSTSGLLVITGNSGILTTTSGVGSSYITNFNSAVSGLIPPSSFTSLSGVSGVVVTNSGTNYTVSLSDPTIQLNDITDLGLDARTFLLTPSSTNLQTLISNETGSGLLVFNTSPALSGIPTVPTASGGTNTTQIANTAFVRTEISNLVNSAPSTLDTLNELATSLGNDPNFATTVTNSLSNKANLSGANFTGSVAIPSGTGNFNSLTVNSVAVSTSGHVHSYSDITNFASGIEQEVSTLLVAGNYVYLNYDSVADTLTISATGVQPSGSYANSVHSHGNITSSGTIGSSAGRMLITTNSGIISTEDPTYIIGQRLTNGTFGSIGLREDNGSPTMRITFEGLTFPDNTFQDTAFNGNDVPFAYNAYSLYSTADGDTVLTLNDGEVYIDPNYIDPLRAAIQASSLTHSHGNISSAGRIGSTSGLLVTTGASGILTTSSGVTSSYITDFNSSVSGLISGIYQPLLINPVTGTGISNHIAYWSSSGIVSADNNELYWDSTNKRLGIGTNVPQAGYKLDVNGAAVIRGSILTNSTITEFGNARYQLHSGASSNQVSYVCNGGGRFGVGFTAPSGLVAISGGVSIGSNYNVTSPTNGLIVEGNVGIGTTTPSGTLNIHNIKNSNFGQINCSNDGILTRTHISIGNEDTRPFLASLNGDLINAIYGWGFIDRATDGNFRLARRAGASTWLDVLHISRSNGWVGINNTIPSGMLDVAGDVYVRNTTNTAANLYFKSTSAANENSLKLRTDTFGNLYLDATNASVKVGNQSADVVLNAGNAPITIGHNSTQTLTNQNIIFRPANTERMRINGSGNIGIGTISPSGLLDVAGNLTFNTFTEKVVANGNSSTAITLNINNGTVHTCKLTNNCVFTMPTVTAGKSFSMFLNTGSGNYTASFTGVLWSDSAPPTITIASNKVDILNFISDGIYWYGSYSQNYG